MIEIIIECGRVTSVRTAKHIECYRMTWGEYKQYPEHDCIGNIPYGEMPYDDSTIIDIIEYIVDWENDDRYGNSACLIIAPPCTVEIKSN